MKDEFLKENNLHQIDEKRLRNGFSDEFNCGVLVINSDDNLSDELFKQLKLDINRTYCFVPFWCEGDDGEITSIKRCLVITNQFQASYKRRPDDNLVEFGDKLAHKYNQNKFIYKPMGIGNIGYCFDLDKDIKHDFYADCLGNLIIKYFKEQYGFKNYAFYMHNSPNCFAEAWKRYGENFYR